MTDRDAVIRYLQKLTSLTTKSITVSREMALRIVGFLEAERDE